MRGGLSPSLAARNAFERRRSATVASKRSKKCNQQDRGAVRLALFFKVHATGIWRRIRWRGEMRCAGGRHPVGVRAANPPSPEPRPASPRLVHEHISCRVRIAVRARPRPARRPSVPAAARRPTRRTFYSDVKNDTDRHAQSGGGSPAYMPSAAPLSPYHEAWPAVNTRRSPIKR